MNNTLIGISNKLPRGLVELYADIDSHAKALAIDYLVVGAMARDLVMVHGFGANIERGTRDVDFAIDVPDWDSFDLLKNRLLDNDYTADSRAQHRLIYTGSDNVPWEIDIVPFGGIEDDNATISWPPDRDFVMNVLGFRETLENAIQVRISEDPITDIKVVSPAGICLLKLIAWMDRNPDKRRKDAADIKYLIEMYPKIPVIWDAMYDNGFMEAQGWDEPNASAMKLGHDVSVIASVETKSFLEKELFGDQDKVEYLTRDMATEGVSSLEECNTWLTIFTKAFRG